MTSNNPTEYMRVLLDIADGKKPSDFFAKNPKDFAEEIMLQAETVAEYICPGFEP